MLNHLLPGCGRLEPHYEPMEITGESIPVAREDGLGYPRISIVVPSYNQGNFIDRTLRSIVSQNYPNLDLIVVDGGSSDGTVGVIRKYANHIQWWVSEADDGQANAINKGLSNATGDIFSWLNSDDCLMPGALFRVAEQFMASDETEVVYGHRVLINEAGQDVGKWIHAGTPQIYSHLCRFYPPGNDVLANRSVAKSRWRA